MKSRRHVHMPSFEDLNVDLSPLIDLVFLLLIFFMTSSTLITFLKDKRVELPIAEQARVPIAATPRLIVNVYENGSIGDEHGRRIDEAKLRHLMRTTIERNPLVRAHIRPDRHVAHAAVQRVLNVARGVGITDVVFAAYTSDR